MSMEYRSTTYFDKLDATEVSLSYGCAMALSSQVDHQK